MKKWTRLLTALMAALLICGMFAACGKGSEVAEIKKSGKLVVLTSSDFPPFEYQGEEGGTIGMDFTESYLPAAQYLLVPAGSGIKTAADLEGKVVGVQVGTTGDHFATQQGNAKSIERYATLTEASAALMSGKLDAVVVDELPARAIAGQNADKLEVAGEKLTEEQYALGVAKDSDLLKKANQVIAELKEEGKIEAFILKHTMQ